MRERHRGHEAPRPPSRTEANRLRLDPVQESPAGAATHRSPPLPHPHRETGIGVRYSPRPDEGDAGRQHEETEVGTGRSATRDSPTGS
ncbi:hypothetical protein GCM10010521_01500 [Streptomyces rameus]|uniref:Uncharacterized protein n=1 Tax=Streptomyces rameus TaxID=68261 RepID=A0ABP6MMQ2_9ACTN